MPSLPQERTCQQLLAGPGIPFEWLHVDVLRGRRLMYDCWLRTDAITTLTGAKIGLSV